MIVEYVRQILGRGEGFFPLPLIREKPRKGPSWIGLKPKGTRFNNELVLMHLL